MTQAEASAKGGRRLDIDRLEKRFGATRAIDSVTLSVPPGALVTLLGPSGCGKTTLMRSIAGFVTPDAGDVRVDGRSIVGLAPERRSTAMLFQSYSLFPHMTVAGNVGFGLRMRGVGRDERERRVGEALRRTRIDELAARFPAQISGGQQQRVALARAIVTEPDILLLDEPFGALDQALREDMQVELRKLQQSLATTTLVVTHDQREALMLSDLIAVMNVGRIEQLGPPSTVYDRPATRFVASFMGFENLLPATLDGGVARAGPLSVPNPNGTPGTSRSMATLAFRADAVLIDDVAGPGAVPARVVFGAHRGSTVLYELSLADGQTVLAAEQRRGDAVRAPGTSVGFRLVVGACTVLAA
jgi:ABC-type Fe3+/spermidine/putrescine transport system ATPase subunit